METKIFVYHAGQRLGPLSIEEVRAAISSGAVLPSDLAWREGMTDWVQLSGMPGLLPEGFVPATAGYPVSGAPTSGLAIGSLCLGISSICCLAAACTGIPAVICGHVALTRIKRAQGRLRGGGVAVAGLVTGYLGILLSVLWLSVVIPAVSAWRHGTFPNPFHEAYAAQSMGIARQIHRACQSYATDHGGALPDTLEDLIPNYLGDPKELSTPGQSEDGGAGFYYFGSGLKSSDTPKRALLISKLKYRHRQVVALFDGSILMRPAPPGGSPGEKAAPEGGAP